MDLPGAPHCVVKQLKPQGSHPQFLKIAMRLFEREAQVLYQLCKHDQIPKIFAYFEENGGFYLVQEIIDGHDLSTELTPGTQWQQEQVIAFLQDVLNILEFVHQQNMIHRDIKPANLIRRASDQKIVLIDFGAVKEISTLGTHFDTVPIGTPGYMPPEQMAGRPTFSSDIYAVGLIGIQALTGIFPRQLPKKPTTGEILWHDKAQVSDEIASILDKMVCYDLGERYQSVTEVLHALADMNKIISNYPSSVSSSSKPTILSRFKTLFNRFKS